MEFNAFLICVKFLDPVIINMTLFYVSLFSKIVTNITKSSLLKRATETPVYSHYAW